MARITPSQVKALEFMKTQPYYVVSDDAYERMLGKLLAGEKMVKSYVSGCPHNSRSKCNCYYFENYLSQAVCGMRDDKGAIKFEKINGIVRTVDGVKKAVIPLKWAIEGCIPSMQ